MSQCQSIRNDRLQFALPIVLLIALGMTGCASDTPAADPVTSTVEASASSDPSPTVVAPEGTFTVPAMVGMNLDTAQDALLSLGSSVLEQQDASGTGRLQSSSPNWVVCTQNPEPGAVVPLSTTVILASVKLNEACP